MDYAYAREKGIPVANVPTYGTASVGQFAIALLLEICHHIGHHDASVHAGNCERCADWCYWDYPLIELDGKTMGIIGFGRIGQTTGRIARAMGMEVLAYDSHPSDAGRAIAEYVDLDALLARSDVVALHCPLFPETEGIINRETIAKMKDGAILLNNSRGPLVVEQGSGRRAERRQARRGGLDVVSTEPIRGDNPLLKAKNCIITPTSPGPPRRAAADHGLRREQRQGLPGGQPRQRRELNEEYKGSGKRRKFPDLSVAKRRLVIPACPHNRYTYSGEPPQGVPDVPGDADRAVPDLPGHIGLLLVDAGVDGPGILPRHPPEGILDDAGGVMFIAHHF